MSPTTIRYTLDRNDLFRARVRALMRTRSLQIMMFICAAFAGYTNFNSPALRGQPLMVKVIATAIAMTIPLAIGVITGLLILFGQIAMKNRGILGEHELSITDAGLIERTEANETTHRWPLHKIFATAHYLYIYVTDTNYHIVPLRAFSSPDQLAAFEAELRRHIGSAKPAPSPAAAQETHLQ